MVALSYGRIFFLLKMLFNTVYGKNKKNLLIQPKVRGGTLTTLFPLAVTTSDSHLDTQRSSLYEVELEDRMKIVTFWQAHHETQTWQT